MAASVSARDAVDARRIDARAGGQQDLDELEARGEVERTVEVAPSVDQHVDAFTIDAERVAEPRPEHVGLSDLAKQRLARADACADQVVVRVDDRSQRVRVPVGNPYSPAMTSRASAIVRCASASRGSPVASCSRASATGSPARAARSSSLAALRWYSTRSTAGRL
ncbi:MAG TPA: hypothetical protein VNS09_16170 [Solirubrobacter sp.]|nr:hypothetical protein [Solirubrobacter sp.]